MTTLVVNRSANRKLGEGTAATYRTQDTCPSSCPLLENGCYARGRIFAIARRGDEDARAALLETAKVIPPRGVLRLNVSGDFLLPDGSLDEPYVDACNEFHRRRPDVAIIAYTHAWRKLTPDLFDFVVNASCEDPRDAEEALALGWQVALIDDGELIDTTIGGRRVLHCLEEADGTTCRDCRVCASDKRTRPIVAFIPHGGGARKATAAMMEVRAQ